MDLPPALIQFLGSLAAILVLAGLAWGLKLGPAPRLTDDEAVRIEAAEAVDGFLPVAMARDSEGRGAIMRDAGGRVLLLRPHGSHFAGRLLSPLASAHSEGDTLVVDTAERRYGAVRLTLADPAVWVRAVDALKSA